jgi:hypothetical protein
LTSHSHRSAGLAIASKGVVILAASKVAVGQGWRDSVN